MQYAIVEISGRQYMITPNQPVKVDYLGEETKSLEAKVLLTSDAGKITLGTPYLKDSLKLEVVEHLKGDKIRVAKYHSKSNTRRVVGSRAKYTKVVLKGEK